MTFVLTGIPGLEAAHVWISIPFVLMYLLAVVGHALVIVVVARDQNLREPMYLFLALSALSDIILCTVTVPKMLIFWSTPSLSTFGACLTQMFFFHALFLSESAVLLAMAYDRYVAICTPLHYTSLLITSIIGKIGLALVAKSVIVVIPGVLLILHLPFCQTNVICHAYCENMGIAKLVCASIKLSNIYGLTAAFLLITGMDFILIAISYGLILRAVLGLSSRESRAKAFGTCGTHICVKLVFYTLAFFSFFSHHFGPRVPHHAHIVLANLYLLVPPTMNPIIYDVKTTEIQVRVVGLFHQLKFS